MRLQPFPVDVSCEGVGGCNGHDRCRNQGANADCREHLYDIVGYAEAACAFQPDIASVLAIVTALYPGAAIASVPEQAVASTICGAVSTVTPVPVTASGRLRAASPVYYPGTNIAIHGTFLKSAR